MESFGLPGERIKKGSVAFIGSILFVSIEEHEFCHFLEGRATYVHESGDVIEITPDTAAFFPKDWKGVCTVHETIKKVYMIR